MNNGVRVDSESIRRLSKNIMDEASRLLQMIDAAKNKVEGSVSFFDSPSAKDFRKKMNEFTVSAKEGANTSLTNLANYFEAVAKTYEKVDEDVVEVANQYLTTDIFG